jgi:eukaryotic-like serine/threonine-protein kinase
MTESYGGAAPRVGELISGKWRLVRRIGAGGMGEVYEAQHTVIGRRFAIKFLHSFLTQNPETMTRFRHEAQAAGGIEHENIAAALDFGTTDDGAPYMVMEYLDGEDLGRLLARSGPLPVPRATYMIIQACRGLAAAHRRGIVHRDLKPENLFICKRVDGSDLVKVVDFGIAKLRTQVTVTQSGMTMGTPCYMSLEQARGAKEVDQRTDIYALGVILYEAISGTRPYPGETYNEVLYNLFTTEPASLDSLRPGLDPRLATAVHRAMAREANARFDSVDDLTDVLIPHAGRPVTPVNSRIGLAGAEQGAGFERPTISSPVSLPSLDASPPPMPVTVTPQKKETPHTDAAIRSVTPGRTRRWTIAVVVAAVLAGSLIYGTWRLFRRSERTAESASTLPAMEEHARAVARAMESPAIAPPPTNPPAQPASAEPALAIPQAASSTTPATDGERAPSSQPVDNRKRSSEKGSPKRKSPVATAGIPTAPARAGPSPSPSAASTSPARAVVPVRPAKEEETNDPTDSTTAPRKKRHRSYDPNPYE